MILLLPSSCGHIRTLHICFMYTASVTFDYYCRDSELSYIRGIGFQSTPPLEGAGVFNVPEGDSPQNRGPENVMQRLPFNAYVSGSECHGTNLLYNVT